jgi:hypothetical protein
VEWGQVRQSRGWNFVDYRGCNRTPLQVQDISPARSWPTVISTGFGVARYERASPIPCEGVTLHSQRSLKSRGTWNIVGLEERRQRDLHYGPIRYSARLPEIAVRLLYTELSQIVDASESKLPPIFSPIQGDDQVTPLFHHAAIHRYLTACTAHGLFFQTLLSCAKHIDLQSNYRKLGRELKARPDSIQLSRNRAQLDRRGLSGAHRNCTGLIKEAVIERDRIRRRGTNSELHQHQFPRRRQTLRAAPG